MLFYKEYNYTTVYNKEEIQKILKEIKKPSEKRGWKFNGNVDLDEFTLLPSFYEKHHYSFRPEVHGTIVSNAVENKVFLKLRIPAELNILFYIGIPLNSIIWFYCFFYKINFEFIIGLPIAGLITIILLSVEFHQRGNRAIQILIAKLKLRKI